MAVDGDTVVVGAPFARNPADIFNSSPGSAYVFVRTGTDWTEEAHLVDTTGTHNGAFGNSVSVSGDTVLGGAQYNDTRGCEQAGTVYVYRLGTPANNAPTAVNDPYSTPEDTALVITTPGALANDTDGNPLTAIKVTDPSHGTVTLNANGSFTYTPAANYSGPDSFTYKANDGAASSNVATVSITVNPVTAPRPTSASPTPTTPTRWWPATTPRTRSRWPTRWPGARRPASR